MVKSRYKKVTDGNLFPSCFRQKQVAMVLKNYMTQSRRMLCKHIITGSGQCKKQLTGRRSEEV